jgi:hypothetical protein
MGIDVEMGINVEMRIDVFSGGLKVDECLFKNEIRSRTLLDGVCFGFFICVPLIYDVCVL